MYILCTWNAAARQEPDPKPPLNHHAPTLSADTNTDDNGDDDDETNTDDNDDDDSDDDDVGSHVPTLSAFM